MRSSRRSSRSARDTLARILADAVDRHRSGRPPAATEYIDRYPDLREQIARQIETLEMVEAGHLQTALAAGDEAPGDGLGGSTDGAEPRSGRRRASTTRGAARRQ